MSNKADIQHVVVLMLENRAFDHMLGTLPGVDGVLDANGQIKAGLVNYADPTDSSSTKYGSQLGSPTATPESQQSGGYGGPSHSFTSATEQVFGVKTVNSGRDTTTPYYDPSAAPATSPTTNSGFVKSFIGELEYTYSQNGTSLQEQQQKAKAAGQPDPVQEIMDVFTADQLPAIHTLAREFCVCDQWHSEVPGPTEPNRLFMHAATSTGLTYNPWTHDIINAPTIFDRITAVGKTWGMYGFDLYDSSNFESLLDAPLLTWEQFQSDGAAGTLPWYSFICPRYADAKEGQANSQHAPYDVRFGEKLIADVYDIVRNGPGWEKTLLIVTYDEHGGYYDHVAPPAAPAPDNDVSPNAYMISQAKQNPKENGYLVKPDYDFDFKTLGIRVPAVLISPWIDKGIIDSTAYRHTSVLKFIEEHLGLEPLTQRDATANSFAGVLSRSTPRTDCPKAVPAPELPEYDPELALKLPPGKKIVDLTRRYTAKLKGHRDTGKVTDREFKTRGDVSEYIKERNRSHDWYQNDDWKQSGFEIYQDKDEHWRWRLKDGDDIVAASTDFYDTRDEARKGLERVRFLSQVLSDPQIES